MSDSEAIERTDGPTGGVYRLAVGGHLAEMTFSRAGAHMIIVARAVSDARQQGFSIFPLCPFAASRFRKNPEYRDVLSK